MALTPPAGLFTPAEYQAASDSDRIDLILQGDRAFISGLCAILKIDYPLGDDPFVERAARTLLWKQLEARRERRIS